MNSNPGVTVITVFLNAEKFIEEAIQSVMAQGFDQWELLLVDDGSTDASTAIAQRYARQYSRKIRYLEHAGHLNRGISASQNLGIARARGKYIAFLDADDVWFPDKLEQQAGILDSRPEAAMVYGQTHYWYSWTGDPQDAGRDLLIQPGVEPDSLADPPSLLVRFLREEIPIPCPSDILVRRDAAIEAGGFEESFRRIFTDQAFYAKLTLKRAVFVAGKNWSKYRRHPDSAVSAVKRDGQMRRARLGYLQWLASYLDQQKSVDQEVRRALRSALWKCRRPGLSRFQKHIEYRSLIIKDGLSEIARQTLPVRLHRLLRAQRGTQLGRRVD
jgi:glycosyltransferase involved in cell wall biosynthesis